MNNGTFSTARLHAERLASDHFYELCRMHRDTSVMATLGGIRTDERTRQFLIENLDHGDRHGYGLWIFRDKADGSFVGRGGLRNVRIDNKDEIEVAYALRAEAWGKGLATEMAAAIVMLAFERLALSELVCFTLPMNKASRRVMEKVGFRFEKDIVRNGLPHVLYRQMSGRMRTG